MKLPKKTPNKFIEKLLTSWDMETIIKVSYVQAAKKWIRIRQNNKHNNDITKAMIDQIEKIKKQTNL